MHRGTCTSLSRYLESGSANIFKTFSDVYDRQPSGVMRLYRARQSSKLVERACVVMVASFLELSGSSPNVCAGMYVAVKRRTVRPACRSDILVFASPVI